MDETAEGAGPIETLLCQASQLQRAGRLGEACDIYDEVLRRDPAQPDALHLLGVISARKGDSERAVGLIERAVARRPQNPVYHFNLANSYKAWGRPRQAMTAYRKAVALKADFAKAWLALGNLLFESDQPEEAEGAYRQALEIDGADPAALARLANLLERSHRLEEAKAALDLGLSLAPGQPMLNLATARFDRREGRGDEALARLRQLDPATLSPEIRSDYHFELGQLHDRRGAFEEAFAQFTEMNRCIADLPAFRAAGQGDISRQIADLTQLLDGPDWPAAAGAAADAEAPVFLVGFPRSGTTLIGQVLDSHPAVQTLDEKPTVTAMVEAAGRLEGGYPACLGGLTGAQKAQLRAAYFQVADRYLARRPDLMLVDKVPLASVHLGLIRAVFPGARIVFALRHPCDVCLSCFMQSVKSHYAPGAFLTLERAAGLYEEVMTLRQLYQTRLPSDGILSLRYEDLVIDFEGKIKYLLSFLDLEWNDAVLDFSSHARTRGGGSATPSYSQVTQPIYRSARYRWKGYAEQLTPVMARLRPFIESFGYADESETL